MRYVVLFRHGPNWNPKRPLSQQGPPIAQHMATMRQHYDEGSLLIGGPFDNGEGIAVLADHAVRLLRRRGFKATRLEDGCPEWKRAGPPSAAGNGG